MPVLFRATPWQDLTNGRFVHKPTTVVAGHSRDTPVRPSTLRTTDAPRTHPPSGQSVLARHADALRRHSRLRLSLAALGRSIGTARRPRLTRRWTGAWPRPARGPDRPPHPPTRRRGRRRPAGAGRDRTPA